MIVIMDKKIILSCIITCLLSLHSIAYELDMSVDEEIQKKYNSSKLNYEVLPNLPKIDSSSQKTQTSVPKTQPTYSTSAPNVTPVDRSSGIKIPSGKKFTTKSNRIIADTLRVGTNVSFTTTNPVYTKYITIPSGSRLNGVIVNSHRPQMSGNGGLVVIAINSLTFNGKTYAVSGKITKANYKKIFLNNIKGKHSYCAGVSKQFKKGKTFYGKTKNVAGKMSNIPIIEFFAPIPKIFGALGYGINAVISPVTGLINKGGSISIPAGSQFEIKLTEDAYVNN